MKTIIIETIDIPVHFDITKLFAYFQTANGAVLLDSANSQHQDAQFNIIAAEPLCALTDNADQAAPNCALNCIINSTLNCQDAHFNHVAETGFEPWLEQKLKQLQTQSNTIKQEPLAQATMHSQVEHIQQALFADYAAPNTALPFILGAIGYLSYDWGKSQENVPNSGAPHSSATQQQTHVYQTPHVHIGFYSWSLIHDIQGDKLYFCYGGDLPHPHNHWLQQIVPQCTTTPDERQHLPSSHYQIRHAWQSNLEQQQYLEKIAAIHEYLLAGDCYQINMAQRFCNQYQGEEWSIYNDLRQHNNAPFSAFIRTQFGAIVSISPERFIKVKDSLVETKPIKGTRPRQLDPEADANMAKDLLTATKDKAENLMIVDLLRNDLSKNCLPNSVKVPKLFDIESFPAVHHLVSTVTGELKPARSPMQLLQEAFPGGSITGAPKVRAMQIIEELEPHHRHIYCGSIFYLGINQDMDSNICIRTLLLENNNIYCWAGGGIVADSNAEHEYQETLDKVAKILPILAEQ